MKKKLNLDAIKVESFITELSESYKQTINGGADLDSGPTAGKTNPQFGCPKPTEKPKSNNGLDCGQL